MSDAAQSHQPDTNSLPPPRNEAARRRISLNARVHGLTAALPETEEEAAAMKTFADHWTKELGPDTAAQEALIRASASAFARVERARKIEEKSMRQSALDAVARWEKKKRHAIRARAQELDKDPVNTVADLECSSFGCEWMMRHWLSIDARLAQGVALDGREIARMMTLFGFVPDRPGPGAEPFVARLWDLAHQVAGFPVPEGLGAQGDPASARVELRTLIANEFARLDQIRQELWDQLDGPEAEAVAHRGLEDTTKAGQLRRRYAKEAFSEMTRGIALVMKIRIENGKFADRLWWQAHAQHKKPRGVTPFHHPEAMPTCLIPDPRPAPAPEPDDEPPISRNEQRSEAVSAPPQPPNTRPEHEMRDEHPACALGAFERSLPEIEPVSAASETLASPVLSLVEAPRWSSETPIRV